MIYKLKVVDRNYEKWEIYDAQSLDVANIPLQPAQQKLFDQDIFHYEEENVKIVHSSVRQMSNIPGILVLADNKTYGRYNKNKFLYKCIPDDKRLPIFLIPHKVALGFNKKLINKYIIFKFLKWVGKHPQGTIIQVLGKVDTLEPFYEYQLYCKSLYASIQNFTKKR